MSTSWSFPTRILFGEGVSEEVGAEAAALGSQRPLVVGDPGVEKAGLLRPILASLQARGLVPAVFTGVEGNPTEKNIEDGAARFKEHAADAIVALGGGSPMDAGKLIAVRARVSTPFEELDDTKGGGKYIPRDVPPLLTLPTTAGTGSEVGRAGVLTVRSTGRKTVVFSPFLLARCALLDPKLTASMPPPVTAATGFDALTHCLEAYLSVGDHPMADAIALGGLELVSKSLARAVEHGDDLEARGAMMKAAMMGAVAFQKGLGACHSLAHPLSSEFGTHHGLANALCLPAVVEFNQQVVPERVERVAKIFDPKRPLAETLRALRSGIGLPDGLAAAGIPTAELARVSVLAFEDGCHRENPRPCTREDLQALYERSV